MSFVLDASATLAWVLPGQETPQTEAFFDAVARDHAIVPAIWHFEVAAVLARYLASSQITQIHVDHFLNDLQTLDIRLDYRVASIAELLVLSRRHSLSGYDAAYLELALRTGLPLATLDKELIEAAHQRGLPILVS